MTVPLTPDVYRKLEEEREQLLGARPDEPIRGARLARVDEILANAEVVVEDSVDADSVSIGSEVTVLDHQSGRTAGYIVDGAHGSMDSNVVTAASPMGLALMGRGGGDVVQVDLPGGRARTLTILDVRPADAA